MADGPGRNWRLELVFSLLMLALPALAGRQIYLVMTQQARAQAAQEWMRMRVSLPGRPGNIFARAGHRHVLLAGSMQVPSCYADPSMLMDRPDLADLAQPVGSAVGMRAPDVLAILRERKDARFAWIQRDLTGEQAQAVEKLKIPGIDVRMEWRRQYPQKDLGGAVLGFRRKDGLPGGGVESAQNTNLAAADGVSVMLGDALRRPFQSIPQESFPPQDGKHVYLCLDVVIQQYLQEAIAASVQRYGAKWGAGVVVDPKTGDILAMASVPTFDSNQFSAATDEQRNNRAITAPYEPGSVFKPLMAAAAVDAGVVTYDTVINCENGIYNAPRGGQISDHGARYGLLTLIDIIVHSSNIGMAKVGERLGNKGLHAALERYGFGQPMDAGLPGESGGIVRDLRKWDGYSTPRVPFGQEVSVTTLQLAMAFSALANGGVRMKPRLVEMVKDSDGQVVYDNEPQEVGRVVGEAAAKGAVEAMRQVVLRGTGRACQLDRWSCFGKTGTAQIPGRGGYEPGAFTGSFVGGAPVENPRVMCLISIYWPNYSKGHYGATVAAPYVKEVLERTLEYLEVPPDLPPETPKLAGAAAPGDAATARSPSTAPPATSAGAGAGGARAVRMDLSGRGRD